MLDMREDGLYTYVEGHSGEPGGWVRIADPFRAPARVSDPRNGASYGLLLEFRDERARPKELVIPASMLQDPPRTVCSMLADQGLYIDRKHQEDLFEYLQQQTQLAQSADLALAPGWLGRNVFVLPDEILGVNENGRHVFFGG